MVVADLENSALPQCTDPKSPPGTPTHRLRPPRPRHLSDGSAEWARR